jgi:hypothetical protein
MTSAALTHDESERRHPRGWSPWVAALVAFALYACTLRGTYIFDDVEVIRNDPRIANPSLWGQYFSQQYMLGRSDKLFRPLVSLSFAIEWWLHGDRPWLFHLVNVLLHAGASAAVAVLGVLIGGRRVGWIAGLLFAVHPVHVEAVAGLVGRSELACTLATVGGLNLFLRRPLSGWAVLAIGGCFLVALLSKEQGLLFPLILLAAVRLRKTFDPPTSDNKSIKWLALLLCAILVLYIQWRERMLGFYWDRYFLDWEFNPLVRSRGIDRILMPVVLLGHYTSLLIAPWKLNIDYGAMVIGWQARPRDPYLWLGAIAVAAWLALFVFALRRRDRSLVLCLIGLALTYGLVANVLALIGTNLAERLMYLPSAFFVLIIAMGLGRFHRASANLVTGLLVVLGAARSVTYADQWNDRLEFYQTTSARQTRSIRGYVLLYTEYASMGQWERARDVGTRAAAVLPMCWEAHAMCVEADLQLGQADRALQDADVGLRDCPNDRGLIGWKQEALKRLRARR